MKPSCASFTHADGCTHCMNEYPHFTLPDGRVVHLYHKDNLNTAVRHGSTTVLSTS